MRERPRLTNLIARQLLMANPSRPHAQSFLQNECFSRLDLLDADTLDAVCHIAMERPKPHDGPTVSKCAVQLLLTARTRAPFGVSGAVVAAVAEEAQAALKSLSQSM